MITKGALVLGFTSMLLMCTRENETIKMILLSLFCALAWWFGVNTGWAI